MPKKGWLSLAGLLLMFFGILFGGPKLSGFIFKKYKERIDKNGMAMMAMVYLKKTHKSNTIHYRYLFKGKLYDNHEKNDTLFTILNIGDSITILLDSTRPSKSYILSGGRLVFY